MKDKRRSIVRSVTSLLLWIEELGFSPLPDGKHRPFLGTSIGPRAAGCSADLGLLALANAVVRSALMAPEPLQFLHTTLPNGAIGTFPYTYIAGLCVPLAVSLHALLSDCSNVARWPSQSLVR